MAKVALCTDDASLEHPELMGLEGENLQAQPWLAVYTQAEEARTLLSEDQDVEEVWVASSTCMDPLNLAAAIKKDQAKRPVYILAGETNGSLKSRAMQAGVDASLTEAGLVSWYQDRKARALASQVTAADKQVTQPLSQVRLGEDCPEVLSPEAPSAPRRAKHAKEQSKPQVGSADCGLVLRSQSLNRSGRQGFLLPLVSGSGGAGKSTVACIAALVAQRAGLNTVLLDLDLQFGDCRELLGYEEALTLDRAIEAPQRINQARSDSKKVALVSPPERMEQAEQLVESLPQLIDAARASYDLVIVNTGCFWTEQHIALLEQCDKAIFLLDQRPSSLRGCKRALDLCTRCGIAASPFVFVVNRCSKTALYSSLDVSCAFRGAPTLELRDGGTEVEDLMAASQPQDIIVSRNPLAISVENLLGRLVPAALEAGVGKAAAERRNNFLASLLRR